MSTLSRRGPGATSPAKLPGVQTSRVTDANTRQALDALREWVEVRLGSRGDKFERSATLRDLESVITRVTALEVASASVTVGVNTSDGAATEGATGTADSTAVANDLVRLTQTVTTKFGALAGVDATLRNDLTAVITRIALLELESLSSSDAFLQTLLARRNKFTAAQTSQVQRVELYDTGTQYEAYPNGDVATSYFILATQSFELRAPEALVDGERYTFVIQQDDTGGRSVTFGAQFSFVAVAPVIGQAAGEATVVTGVAVTGFVGGTLRQTLLCDVYTGFSLTLVRTVGRSVAAGLGLGVSTGPFTYTAAGASAAAAVVDGRPLTGTQGSSAGAASATGVSTGPFTYTAAGSAAAEAATFGAT